jgi:transcriptional regulator
MYVPEAFRETRLPVLHALIGRHPLGLLVSAGPDGILADPVPFTLVPDAGADGLLRAHVARANPHWKALRASPEAVVVFQGPDAYVTPAWYAAKAEHGKVVPTWNYVVIEVRGAATVIEDPGWLRAQLEALTGQQEAARAEPWAVGDAPEPFVASQIRGIVGLEIPIREITGKWKLSQNRAAADRDGVVAGFEAEGDPAMAALVRAPG